MDHITNDTSLIGPCDVIPVGAQNQRFPVVGHHSVSFCICGRSFKLISFPFVWERETLAAVHSTHNHGFWPHSVIDPGH